MICWRDNNGAMQWKKSPATDFLDNIVSGNCLVTTLYPSLVTPEPCLSLNLTHLHLYVQQDIKETVLIAMEVLTRSANVPIYHVKPAFNILHRGSIVRITHCSIEQSWFIWFLIEPASFTEFQPSLRPCQCRRQRHIQVAKAHTKTRTKTSHYSIEQT